MERYHKSGDRNQLSFQAVSLDDILPENAEVRSLEAIIDHMDIVSLGFCHAKTKQTGRKPYDPVDMFKIYAYSYFNGIRSSRKIERECYRNIELMWLVNGIRPDHKTIANFRKDNKVAITQAFKNFGLLCSRLGLVGKEMVAIDGSKFRACNSRDACYSKGKIENMLSYHGKLVAKYIKLLDSTDEQEANTPQPTREEIIQKLEHSEQRLVELSLMKAEVLEYGTIYETDKDARLMKSSNNGVNISHNVQIAVDDKHHLVVAVDVTSQPEDKEQLYNMASQAKQQLGTDTLTVLADKGYYSGSEFKRCIEDGVTPIVSKAIHKSPFADDEYGKEAFRFDEQQGGYICPQGQLLSPQKRSRKENGSKRYRNLEACAVCPVKLKCTSASSKGRSLEDKPYSEYARQVDRQTKQKMDAYHKRKQLVEHPFGTVKQTLGFTHFLTRGTESVRAESALHFLAYNMRRAINIMGTEGLKAALAG